MVARGSARGSSLELVRAREHVQRGCHAVLSQRPAGSGGPQALPPLNPATWRVSPDGRMETTYRLRPGLPWHDGRSLTADDFVFAWGVYSTPGLALFLSNPQDMMEEVTATDPRTFTVRWRVL